MKIVAALAVVLIALNGCSASQVDDRDIEDQVMMVCQHHNGIDSITPLTRNGYTFSLLITCGDDQVIKVKLEID